MSQLRGRPFQPGNTFGRGRPKGSRNKTTRKMQELLDRYLEPITQKLISMAMKGDPVALRLCVERLSPARRDGYVQIRLAGAQTVGQIIASNERVLQGVARGEITPTEGESICRILEERRRSIDTVELAARIEKLEQSVPGKKLEGGIQ
jgi:hypothetical protein